MVTINHSHYQSQSLSITVTINHDHYQSQSLSITITINYATVECFKIGIREKIETKPTCHNSIAYQIVKLQIH